MTGDITYVIRCYVAGKECDAYTVTTFPSAARLFNNLMQLDAEDQWFDAAKLIEREELTPRSEDIGRTRYRNTVLEYWSSQEGTDVD